ncbi:ATP-binding protein [Natranaerobius thermophilus]|uniref:4Fe-4S ferredoxin iron-sulfur binding domain protein n=1 Tax=Natranaerobius thermophilus (strain ATCC BAA-1301 / DSM 18059 / JW/NM-WN-LF) TaxID=457570 RepID=B2A5H2_NATTJ|nr:4Fe-4S binding protein [Natranaerobius thermophilus]ACB85327.1 4Fe-4S ferredoxin iron-sulfur binding domain protein [Natranaerobius thermophilus JW/NM-WN-LF]
MNDKIVETGVPSEKLQEQVKPPEHRREQGPVVMVECFQEIPCDPCNKACNFGAIKPFEDINDLPEVDFDKCNGCGVCVGYCPGLAIFIIDETYSQETDLVKIPYEFSPLPEKGQVVQGLDREGKYVTDVKVSQVRESSRKNRVYILSLEVPKGYGYTVRNISFTSEGGSS